MLERLKNDKVLFRAVESYLKAHYWQAASFYQLFQISEAGDLIGIKEGFEIYMVSENIEIIGLIAFCGGGLTLVHFVDERVKSKYSVLKTLLALKPSCLKGDTYSVTLAQKILEKSMTTTQDEQYHWMSIDHDQLENLTEKKLLDTLALYRQSGVELSLASDVDFQEMVPFLIEVEKCFNRNPLSVNQLKKKMTERSLSEAYLLVQVNNQVIGQGLLEYGLPKHRLIGGIYVSMRHRNKGIGLLLTRALVQVVLEKNMLPALTVEVGNEEAIKLYKRLGFEICGDQKNSYIRLNNSNT
jgi:GNAT superfamily N-acetyltransferase